MTTAIHHDTLVPWLADHVPGLVPPVQFDPVVGGRSNLTYVVTDAADHRYVLRRPPVKQVLATAHDMGREYRIIGALGSTSVPAPEALAFCDDVEVNGAPFYVMAFVEGHVVRDRDTASRVLTETARRATSASLAATLAAIHAVDVDAVGLGDLSRRDGYLARQLRRWRSQLDHATSEVPEVLVRVHDALRGAMPEQRYGGLVHGDYRLDNCIVGDDGSVRAVLDWELCALGDTLADLGMLLVYWSDPVEGDVDEGAMGRPTSALGFFTRDELVERYAAITGRDLVGLDYYVAFAHWRIACILQGVVDRFRDGAMGDSPANVYALRKLVARNGEVAAAKLKSSRRGH